MIGTMSLSQLAQALGAELHGGDGEFTRLSTDTRAIVAGDLFVALRGENFDAHQFLDKAAEQGACGLVVEAVDDSLSLPQLKAADTLNALGQIAALNRQRFSAPLIAVTGSGGKTTVKGMLAAILSRCAPTLATKGNLNNHIGVPLTLMELSDEHRFAVIEMGASGPGEIAYLCDLAQPDVALITNVMAAHIEGFGSLDGVANAKGEIYRSLSATGCAVINADEPYAGQWLAQMPTDKVVRFSVQDAAADVLVTERAETGFRGLSFELKTPLGTCAIKMPIIGKHNLANAAAAAAAAYAAGATLEAIAEGLESFQPVAGRMQLNTGLNNACVIDDSYNANPGSVRAAIAALKAEAERMGAGNAILVLGDLAELGSDAEALHEELGMAAKAAEVNQLVTVGDLSRLASEAFGDGATHCKDHSEAIECLRPQLNNNTVVLVKGSRSARMETVVQALVAPVTEYGEE